MDSISNVIEEIFNFGTISIILPKNTENIERVCFNKYTTANPLGLFWGFAFINNMMISNPNYPNNMLPSRSGSAFYDLTNNFSRIKMGQLSWMNSSPWWPLVFWPAGKSSKFSKCLTRTQMGGKFDKFDKINKNQIKKIKFDKVSRDSDFSHSASFPPPSWTRWCTTWESTSAQRRSVYTCTVSTLPI